MHEITDPRQPCIFPGCLALFDPRQEDADPGDGHGLLTGWQWPAGAAAAEDPELPAHDHLTSNPGPSGGAAPVPVNRNIPGQDQE